MPTTIGKIVVEPLHGITVDITVTDAGSGQNTSDLYTTEHGSTAVSWADSISSRTVYYVARPGRYTVSAKYNGKEIAGGENSTVTVEVLQGQSASVQVALDPNEQVDIGASLIKNLSTGEVHSFVDISTSDHADFELIADESVTNSGTRNPVLFMGYNTGTAGAREDATEPGAWIAIEADYNNGSTRLVEMHMQYVHTDGTVIRPLSFTVDRSTQDVDFSQNVDTFTINDRAASSQVLNYNGAAWFIKTDVAIESANLDVGKTGTGNNGFLELLHNSGNEAGVKLTDEGGEVWRLYKSGGDTLYLRDMTNGRMHLQYNQGASATAAEVQLNSILRYGDTGLFQTTVGAAGAADALPANPTKYMKVKDNAGTTFVVPVYAAS